MSCVSPIIVSSPLPSMEPPVGPVVAVADALSSIMPESAGFGTSHVYIGYDEELSDGESSDDSTITVAYNDGSSPRMPPTPPSTPFTPSSSSIIWSPASSRASHIPSPIPSPSPLRRQRAVHIERSPYQSPVPRLARRGVNRMARINRSPGSSSPLSGCVYRNWGNVSVHGFVFGHEGSLKLKVRWVGTDCYEYPFIEQAPHHVVVSALNKYGFETRRDVFLYYGKQYKQNFCCNSCARVFTSEQVAGCVRLYCGCRLEYTGICRLCHSLDIGRTCNECDERLSSLMVQRSM